MHFFLTLWISLVVVLAGCDTGPMQTAQATSSSGKSSTGASQIDRRQQGTYRAGKWRYEYTLTNPGTRSEGARGRLYYEDRQVPAPPNRTDYYQTPLGTFYYAARPHSDETMPWQEQGWMPLEPGEAVLTGRRLLAPPGSQDSLIDEARSRMGQILAAQEALGKESVYLQEEADSPDPQASKEIDPWGTPYKIFPDFRSAEGGGMVARLIIRSAGPDKVFNTRDDMERHSRFIRIE